jgi:hypothetical protein
LQHGLRALRPELVLLNFYRRNVILSPHHSSSLYQFEGYLTVELSRPTYGQLHPPPWNQQAIGGKQDTVATHVYGFTCAEFIAGLSIQDLIANFALDRKPV